MGMLTNDHVRHWTNEKHDLYTDDRLMTFGHFKDFFTGDEWFYCKYPNGSVKKLDKNVWEAIKEFNELED